MSKNFGLLFSYIIITELRSYLDGWPKGQQQFFDYYHHIFYSNFSSIIEAKRHLKSAATPNNLVLTDH